MNKIDVGQTINTLANVGVIAGIMFLAFELHQNNELLEQQERHTFLENVVGFTEFVSSSDDVASLIYRPDDAAPLSGTDKFRRCLIALNVFYKWQWEFDNLEILPDGPVAQAWRVLWRQARLDDCWELNQNSVNADFRRFIVDHVIN